VCDAQKQLLRRGDESAPRKLLDVARRDGTTER